MRRAIIIGSSPEVRAYGSEIYCTAESIIAINYAYKNIKLRLSDRVKFGYEDADFYRVAADNDAVLADQWANARTSPVYGKWEDVAPWKQNYSFKRWDDPTHTPDDLPTYVTSLVPAVYFAGCHLEADEIILIGCPFIKHAGTTRREGPAEGDTEWEDLAEQVSSVLKQMPIVPKTTTLNSPLDLEYFPLHKLLEDA